MIKVFIVDDHDLFRAGVRAELPDDFEVIGDASEVAPAIEMIRERRPDLVLVDVHMPILRVVEGDAVFSPKLAGFVLDAFSSMEIKDLDPDLDKLTKREREVLQHIARGYTYREVGEQLYISTKTVENHMSAVLRKLQLSNRRELTRWAQDRDLI